MQFLIALLALSPVTAFAAGGLAYVRATSQLQPERDRGRYHPLNLLDDDPGTMWCEGDAGLGENQSVTIYFKKKQRIDRVLLVPAESSGRRIEQVRVSDGQTSITVDLNDVPVEQVLRRPLEGTTYELRIERVGGPNTHGQANDVACLADAVLALGNLPFGQRSDSRPHYDDKLDKLL